MKTILIVGVLAIVIQLAVAFLPYIPKINDVFLPTVPTARQELDELQTSLGISFAILTAAFLLAVAVEQHHQETLRDEVRLSLIHSRVEQLRDNEFYEQFLFEARRASSYVWISYFAPYPPDDTSDAIRKRYDRDMLDLIKRSPQVRFRRLIRNDPRNRAWAAKMVSTLEGCPNADVAVLDGLGDEDMPLALAIQIIDDQRTWFVALDSHDRIGTYRDLFIENAKMTEAAKKYYERLWARAVVVLSSGRPQNLSRLQDDQNA